MREFGKGLGLMAGFLVLAVVAVAVGYLYGNHLFRGFFAQEAAVDPAGREEEINPNLPAAEDPPPGDEAPEEETAQEPVHEVVQLPELRLFVLQLGAFGQMENALRLKDDLQKEGLAAYVTDQPLHRVQVLMVDQSDVAQSYAGAVSHLTPEEPGIWALSPLGQTEGGISVTVRSEDPASGKHAVDMLKALNSFLQDQGRFWSQVTVGERPRPPVFDHPRILSPDDEGWKGELARLLILAETQSENLQEARSQGFPQDWEAESMSLFMKLVHDYRSLLRSLAEAS